MRRFFRAHRDENYSQIQYLTAKCTRLTHDKGVLDREFLVSRERERKLQNDLEAVTTRLLQQEQLNIELRMNQDQLISRIHQQQDLVGLLQQRVVLLVEESSRDAELLQQVSSELLCLQSSEVQLQCLVEQLHAEAQHRAAVADSLKAELHAEAQQKDVVAERFQAELRSKMLELEELQDTNRSLREELRELRKAHSKEVRELQQENEGSLKKLQETAEQFEWLCQQQRYWMCCVKRFKDCLMEERRVGKEKELHDGSLKQTLLRPLPTTEGCDSLTSWDEERRADLDSQVEDSNIFYEELFNQAGNPVIRNHKPP